MHVIQFARKSLVWLVAAVYLLDGVLAGAAHVHEHSHSTTNSPTAVQTPVHSHAHCGHHHHDHVLPKGNEQEQSTPSVPHEHKDCTACQYSSLSAAPVTLVVVPDMELSVAAVAARLPLCPATKLVSLHPARGPPAAA